MQPGCCLMTSHDRCSRVMHRSNFGKLHWWVRRTPERVACLTHSLINMEAENVETETRNVAPLRKLRWCRQVAVLDCDYLTAEILIGDRRLEIVDTAGVDADSKTNDLSLIEMLRNRWQRAPR